MIAERTGREKIVAEARNWIGTPYLHQASVKGRGADCLGLVRGVWRSLIGDEPQAVPGYSKDWSEVSQNETMLDAARTWFHSIELDEMQSGDLILFRWRSNNIIKHAGILTGSNQFIHAYERAGVVETTLGTQWRNRIAVAFKFPNINSDG